jgi:hypothetical protein
MMQKIHRLSAIKIASIKTRGMYGDGGGLYLQVGGTGSRSWIFRFKKNGRTRDMGLGSLTTVSLAKARACSGVQARPLEQKRSDRGPQNGARQSAIGSGEVDDFRSVQRCLY